MIGRGRARPAVSQAGGGRRRAADPVYAAPVRKRSSVRTRGAVAVWTLLWIAATAVGVAHVADVDLPDPLVFASGALLGVLFTGALVHRCGGRVVVWSVLAAAVGVGAYLLDESWTRSAAAVLTATTAAVLAVLATRPAPTAFAAVREVVLATVLAASGAVGVASIGADVVPLRFSVVVLVLALGLTLAVVWGLGAGLHGLGRRGLALIVAGAVVVASALAYAAILRAYGDPALTEQVESLVAWMRDTLGGVPRPTEVLVGFPALLWGVSTRAHRRQGWWMSAFGVVATGTITVSLVSPDALADYFALSTTYSLVLGLVLGLLVRALDRRLTGVGSSSRSRRAARDEADAVRPEPGRTSALR